MKMSYFAETDTLYLELRRTSTSETRDLDENTLAEFDLDGNLIAITLEHASSRTDITHLSLSGIAA